MKQLFLKRQLEENIDLKVQPEMVHNFQKRSLTLDEPPSWSCMTTEGKIWNNWACGNQKLSKSFIMRWAICSYAVSKAVFLSLSWMTDDLRSLRMDCADSFTSSIWKLLLRSASLFFFPFLGIITLQSQPLPAASSLQSKQRRWLFSLFCPSYH